MVVVVVIVIVITGVNSKRREGLVVVVVITITGVDLFLFSFNFFCSGFRDVSGCGTHGEHVAAPATEPASLRFASLPKLDSITSDHSCSEAIQRGHRDSTSWSVHY